MKELCTRLKSESLSGGSSILAPADPTPGRACSPTRSATARSMRFAANVDPHDLQRALEGGDPASTLVVVVSKTFTTQETMANAAAARQWGARHFFAVTANVDAARAFGAEEILPMWDWVGGRFSVWSAVGFAAACAIGWNAFEEFLSGGHEVDEHFAQQAVEKNVPVLMALAGVWNTNFLGAPTHVVLPYSHALRLLPAYLSSSRWNRTASASIARGASSTMRPRPSSGAAKAR